MRDFLLPLLSFLFSSVAFADNAAPPIPGAIVAAQNLMVQQGNCEADWQSRFAEVPFTPFDLGNGAHLWILPCANWAYNMDSTIYATFDEPSLPEGVLAKQIFFVSYSPYQSLFAENVAHNVRYDSATRTIETRTFISDQDYCGAAASYSWNSDQQNFTLQKLFKQDDCKNPSSAWQQIYPLNK